MDNVSKWGTEMREQVQDTKFCRFKLKTWIMKKIKIKKKRIALCIMKYIIHRFYAQKYIWIYSISYI